jgi:hypothetical protein
MIRFGVIVSVVVAAVGLLIVGAVGGDLKLVYGSIGLAALALLLLIIGVAVWRDQVFASSGQRGERHLAAAGGIGQAGRPAGGLGTAEDWRERLAPGPGSAPTAGSGQSGDTREFVPPVGVHPERNAPADPYRRVGEPRPADAPHRPADVAGGPGREAAHRDRHGREAPAADRPGREAPAAADWPGREEAAAQWGNREAAADRAAREPVSARRPDRVERYPTMAVPDRVEPADDPTRLAHRLDSLADLGRQDGPDTASTIPPPTGLPGGQRRPARAGRDPLAGPGEWRPAGDPISASPSPGPVAPRPGAERGAGTPPSNSPGPAVAVPSATVTAAPVPPVPAAAAPATATPASVIVPGAGDTDLATARPAVPPSATGVTERAAAVAAEPSAAVDAAQAEPSAAGAATTDGGPPAVGPDDMVSVVPGIARYHKADCILIRFLSEEDLELTPRREAEATGCAPCRACRPDRPSATS